MSQLRPNGYAEAGVRRTHAAGQILIQYPRACRSRRKTGSLAPDGLGETGAELLAGALGVADGLAGGLTEGDPAGAVGVGTGGCAQQADGGLAVVTGARSATVARVAGAAAA